MTQMTTATRDLVLTRLLNAPIELAWKAFTEPDYVMRWWGPSYFTSPLCKMDFREGGTTLVAMRSPDGQDSYSIWDYQEIVPLQRIEYIQNLADESGNKIDPADLGLPADFPKDVRTVITFRAMGNMTEITITEHDLPATGSQMSLFAELGLHQSLDKLYAIFAAA